MVLRSSGPELSERLMLMAVVVNDNDRDEQNTHLCKSVSVDDVVVCVPDCF